MKAVILAGGLGTRMREETEYRPKPMVEIGGRPILWHIMKHLSVYGVRDFIVAVGYRGDMIKEYFLNYEARSNDFTVKLGDRNSIQVHGAHSELDWSVTVADTGSLTPTGGRVASVATYLDQNQPFLVAYGDGVADVNVDSLLHTHHSSGTLATVTIARPISRFGVVEVTESGRISQFREKPQLKDWVNIGYFIFDPGVLAFLDASSILEEQPLSRLTEMGQLGAYYHDGFWQPMDTFKEAELLNKMWESGCPPWRTW